MNKEENAATVIIANRYQFLTIYQVPILNNSNALLNPHNILLSISIIPILIRKLQNVSPRIRCR